MTTLRGRRPQPITAISAAAASAPLFTWGPLKTKNLQDKPKDQVIMATAMPAAKGLGPGDQSIVPDEGEQF